MFLSCAIQRISQRELKVTRVSSKPLTSSRNLTKRIESVLLWMHHDDKGSENLTKRIESDEAAVVAWVVYVQNLTKRIESKWSKSSDTAIISRLNLTKRIESEPESLEA